MKLLDYYLHNSTFIIPSPEGESNHIKANVLTLLKL
jgi:hypothetical protein